MPEVVAIPNTGLDNSVIEEDEGSRSWTVRIIVIFLVLGLVAGIITLAVYLSRRKSNNNTTTCTLPPPPVGLTVSSPQPGTIVVAWSTVSSASGYRVYRSIVQPNGTGSIKTTAAESRPIFGNNINSTTFNGLTDPTQYISVSSTNACGESDEGTVQQIIMSCDLASVANLNLMEPIPGNITATWSAVSGASNYEIFVQTNTGNLVDTIPPSGPQLHYNFTGSGLISVTVNAANSCGTGPLSSVSGTFGS